MWLDRPWEIRYVLFGENAESKAIEIRGAKRRNAEKEVAGKEKIYLEAAALFTPTATLAVPGARAVAVVVLRFDKAGRVIARDGPLRRMSAKRNLLDDLVLISEESPGGRPYLLAEWSQGIPGAAEFSPAVCDTMDTLRYEDGWDIDDYSGNFGCREWTAQLYDRHLPYIDVTSYAPDRTYIGEFVGWSRFEDPPKPVIGKQENTWLCLHECPGGEKPGVIPDIKAWAMKHGFPMPQRPPKQPLYPNADYLDDLNEFEGAHDK